MENETIVIVIDPGHGGENLGAEYENFVEKELTLKVADAMYKELSTYDGIEIHMTRTVDQDLTLKERVEVAEKYDADFFFCLHFNMSVNHDLYGAETWISAFGENYAQAYDFAKIEMEQLTGLGLFDRGIKTKLKGKKDEDYYGVIRAAKEADIPSVIIEHCHLDNIKDYPYYHEDTEEWLETFGKLDAEAVAKYFGLKSSVSGKDFSEFTYEKTAVPKDIVRPDGTDPEESVLTLLNADTENNIATLQLNGYDSDCRLIYYTYSYDEGDTVSERFEWPLNEKQVTFEVPLAEGTEQELCAVVYNLFDRRTISNSVILPAGEVQETISESIVTNYSEEQDEKIDTTLKPDYDNYTEIAIPDLEAGSNNDNVFLAIMLILCIIIFSLLVTLGITMVITNKKKNKRKKLRKQE